MEISTDIQEMVVHQRHVHGGALYKFYFILTSKQHTWLRLSSKSRSYSPTFACSSARSVSDCLSLNSTEDNDVYNISITIINTEINRLAHFTF